MSLGAYFYNLKNPWEFIPYTIIALAVIWWLVISYNLITKHEFTKLYGIACSIAFTPILSIYILIVPTVSILARAYVNNKQTTDITFFSLSLYILVLNGYYRIIVKYTSGVEGVTKKKAVE